MAIRTGRRGVECRHRVRKGGLCSVIARLLFRLLLLGRSRGLARDHARCECATAERQWSRLEEASVPQYQRGRPSGCPITTSRPFAGPHLPYPPTRRFSTPALRRTPLDAKLSSIRLRPVKQPSTLPYLADEPSYVNQTWNRRVPPSKAAVFHVRHERVHY